MKRTLGPFRVFSETTHMVTINKIGIHDTVTIDWVSTAPEQYQENITTQLKSSEDSLVTDLQVIDRSSLQSPKD